MPNQLSSRADISARYRTSARTWSPRLRCRRLAMTMELSPNFGVRLTPRTWVTPQRAVVAYLRDPDFLDQARVRLLAGRPVNASRLTPRSPLERQVACGPTGAPERSAKAVSALIYLFTLGGPSEWITSELASPDLLTLLSADSDNASSIAEAWHGSLKTIRRSLATKTD